MLSLSVVFLIHSQSYVFCLCCNYSRCKVYFYWVLLAIGPSALILDLFQGCPTAGRRSLSSLTVWIFREVCNTSLLVSHMFDAVFRDVTRVYCFCSLSHFFYDSSIIEMVRVYFSYMFLFRSHFFVSYCLPRTMEWETDLSGLICYVSLCC